MTCPDPNVLQAFSVGDLDDTNYALVARHVSECPRCARLLERHDGFSDGLVDGLRDLDAGTETHKTVPDAWIESVKQSMVRRRGGGSGQLVVDAGQHIDAALVDGPVRIGKFELERKLGVGSFGYVFWARDSELDRAVAIKVQRGGDLADPHESDRFLREARSIAQLDHPGVVSLYETGQTDDGACYLVTEYVEGQTLERRMDEHRFDFNGAARLVSQLAEILHYAHESGVIHRDVKPSNIMLDEQDRPHVMDFGLAKREFGDTTMTVQGQIMGTPAYMSPEQARGESHDVDARSDLFSLGVILYELLTGERPFQGNRRMLILQVLEDEPRPPRRLNERVPRDLETICLKAMSKAPNRRYASAGELRDDLNRYLANEPIRARPINRTQRLLRWCRRNPVAASLLIAVTLGSVIGVLQLAQLSRVLIRRSAIDSAAQYAEMLEEVNDVYSAEVVDRVGEHGIEATADYAANDGQIPLPATLLRVLLENISRRESGMRGRQYSEYPFRFRSDGGPRDEYERAALAALRENPSAPYIRFVEDYDGIAVLRYSVARTMKRSCVDCHNRHPDSIKRDWARGDVRGVLEIIRPLDKDIRRVRDGLRDTFVVLGTISAALLVISVLVLVGRKPGASRTP